MKKIHFVILAELIIMFGCMFLWCFLRKQTVDNERKCLVQLPQSPLDARRLKPQIVEASAGQHVRADRAENRQTELRLMAEMLYGDFTLENAQKYVEEAERFVLYVFYGVRTETPWTRVEKEAAFLNFVTNMWQLDFTPRTYGHDKPDPVAATLFPSQTSFIMRRSHCLRCQLEEQTNDVCKLLLGRGIGRRFADQCSRCVQYGTGTDFPGS